MIFSKRAHQAAAAVKKGGWREYLAVFFLLAVILSFSFYEVFFLGKTFKITTTNSQAMFYGVYGQKDNKPSFIPVNGTDTPVLEEPMYEFIKQSLREGILPLWNPHQALGFPLIAMIEVGIFFPLSLILYLLPQLYSWDVLIISRFLLAGILTYWLLRTLKCSKMASLGAAVTFMLSGPMVLLQYWFVNVDIIAPLLLLCLEKLIQRPNRINCAFAAVAVALTFFGGHPEHIFFVNAFGFLFFCFRVFTLRKSLDWKKPSQFLGLCYCLGIGMSAVILFPFLYNMFFELWSAHPPLIGLTTGEVQNRFITIFLPHFFQKEPLTYTFTFAGWWGGYIGLLPFALAFFGVFNKHGRGLNHFLGIIALIIITKSYSVPVVNWIGYLPILDSCRFYVHTYHLFALIIAILAAMGIEAILASRAVFKKGLLFSFITMTAIAAHLFFFKNADHWKISLEASLWAFFILIVFQAILFLKDRSLLKAKPLSAVLIAFLSLELFSYIRHERPRRFDSFPKVPYIEFLKENPERERSYGLFWTFYPNTATGYRVDDLGVFMSLVPKRFVSFTIAMISPKHFKNNLRPPALRSVPFFNIDPILDLLNVGTLVSAGYKTLIPGNYIKAIKDANVNNRLIYAKEVNISRRPGVFPRAFVVHRAISLPDEKLLFEKLKELGSKLRNVAVLQEELAPEVKHQLAAAPLVSDSTAQITKYTPNEVVIRADLDYPGFLILSDAFHPDWRAYVDSAPSKIYTADYLLRSVFLTAGSHEVRFVFKPRSFYAGMTVSAVSFLLVLILFAGQRIQYPFRFKNRRSV